MTDNALLAAFIHEEWRRAVPKEVEIAAKDIARRYGDSVTGVIFYGSCLRTGEIEDKILDFYVIVDDYRKAYSTWGLAFANKMLPPNVFYHELNVGGTVVRSKYAVLSLQDLAERTGPNCLNVSVWARFCQPCKFIIPRDDTSLATVENSIAQAVSTMLANLLALKPWAVESGDLWVEAFEQTYASELRSEPRGKGREIYLLDMERYDALTPLALECLGVDPTAAPKRPSSKQKDAFGPRMKWMMRRWNGKLVSFLRLLKATATFDGGIDYIAWKIRRHSGVEIEVKDWMRKHPIIAGVSLFWNLRKKGAFK